MASYRLESSLNFLASIVTITTAVWGLLISPFAVVSQVSFPWTALPVRLLVTVALIAVLGWGYSRTQLLIFKKLSGSAITAFALAFIVCIAFSMAAYSLSGWIWWNWDVTEWSDLAILVALTVPFVFSSLLFQTEIFDKAFSSNPTILIGINLLAWAIMTVAYSVEVLRGA